MVKINPTRHPTIRFRTDTDIAVKYRHDNGTEESMNLSRIVQAYADVMGIEFRRIGPSWSINHPLTEPPILDPNLYFGVSRYQEKIYLNAHGFKIELPDITKVWTGVDSAEVWKCIDYLMRM